MESLPPIRSKRLAFLPIATGVVALDQLGKYQTAHQTPSTERIPLLGDVLSFAHAPTAGGAFGFFSNWTHNAQLLAFALLSVAAIMVVVSFYRGLAPREFGSAAGLGAILGGVSSAMIDRVRVGVSVDFIRIDLPSVELHPDFNLADVAIVLGVVTLIVELLATEMAARASERPRR